MERGQESIMRAMTLTESGTSVGFSDLDEEGQNSKTANGSPAQVTGTHLSASTKCLSRSASLSEKELKEARDRSQIIAAQLTIPSNAHSRGVQLFNRRKARVNAFTLVSFGKGVSQEDAGKDQEGELPQSALTWEETCINRKDGDLNGANSSPSALSSLIICKGSKTMEDQGKNILEADSAFSQQQDRHFLPVNEKQGTYSGEPTGNETACEDFGNRSFEATESRQEVDVKKSGADSFILPGPMPNGRHGNGNAVIVSPSLTKQATAIKNRTARPFGSPDVLRSPETRSPELGHAPAPFHSGPALPTFHKASPLVFSPLSPPPAFSPSPVTAPAHPPPPAFSSPPPVSHIISPSPLLSQYTPPVAQRPQYNPELMGERKQQVPIRTGVLDEGRVRRTSRKSMFTFQEKPKVAPNPELLSLVQGVDEKKKLKSQPEPVQEEELLALGAEASNFLTKDIGTFEEAKVPEWSSCLKRSGPRFRPEPKPEQGLINVSGKGAELFARRQSRMEKYVVENPSGVEKYVRSPSPTMSLPPSWTFPSNMPGRVKAMASSGKINLHPPRTVKPTPTTSAKTVPKAESAVLENGCSKIEMELSKHKPYQLNSSLFILNPTKDPMSSLPKAAPAPKPIVLDKAYMRQTSLPVSPPSLSPHLSSPVPFRSPKDPSSHSTQSPVNGMGAVDVQPNYGGLPGSDVGNIGASPVSTTSPKRVVSPRSATQAPRPTFSARNAGIQPQTRREAPPTSTVTWTPLQSRRISGSDGPPGGIKAGFGSEMQASSPLSPTWDDRCLSPSAGQDDKTNRRLLAKNIINAAKRKNSPSPGAPGGPGMSVSPAFLPLHSQRPFSPYQSRSLASGSPTFISPPATPTCPLHSPVCLYTARSLTDSDASAESEDSGLKSPGGRSYNTCPRGWGGSLRLKRGNFPADL